MIGKNALFISGTDTGVGKTHVSRLLASFLKGRFKVGVMKPVESGCAEENGRLIPSDATALRQAAGCELPLEVICPYRFSKPLAPSEAARQEGVVIDTELIRKTFEKIAAASDLVLAEGAGGLLAPVYGNYFCADLVRDLGLPLLIVARAGLGTVNHSLLTLEAALARGIRVAAIVLNENTPHTGDPSYECNGRLLRDLAPVPVVGPLPFADKNAEGNINTMAAMERISRLAFPDLTI